MGQSENGEDGWAAVGLLPGAPTAKADFSKPAYLALQRAAVLLQKATLE